MSLADELASQAAQSVRAERPTHPQGWEPGISFNGQTGTITSRPIAEPGPDWAELLRVWGFDPDKVEVVEPVQVRTWDAAIGNGETRTMWYYRAGIRQRREGAPDVAELIKAIRSPRKPSAPIEHVNGAFGYCAADWQAGKKGTDAMVERVLASFEDAAKRYRELRRIGRQFDAIYFLGLGDLHEGCKDHYCVTTDTPVLTADLRWVKAGTLRVGDELYAITEHPQSVRGRRYERAWVTAQSIEAAEVVRVTFDNGESMTCTPEHPFLAAKSRARGVQMASWVAAKDLTPSHHVAKMFDVWEQGQTFDHGWLGGMYDGEGHLSAGAERSGPNILGVAQLPGPLLDRMKRLLDQWGFAYTDDDGKGRVGGTHNLRTRGGYHEVLRLLGTVRPERLIRKVGLPYARAKSWPKVVSVEPAGTAMIARMSTSSRTFFAAGYAAHNSMQPFEVELDNRAQARVVRHLWAKGVDTFAQLAPVVCAAIGGNHGEERHEGKAYTTFADNKDVASVEAVAEAYRGRSDVTFLLPEGDLTLTLDIGGLIVGIAHGHQARRGTTPQQKVREWWKDQAFGRRPIGDSDLLLTGHYHHLSILSDGGRTHMQAPTMDSGSQWWEETAGMPTTPGALTFTVQGGRWQDVQLL